MRKALMVLGLLAVTIPAAMAANTANQTVTFQVSAINEISVSGNPGALTVSTATAGAEPDQVTDATTTYNLTTNGNNKKITGALDTAMPSDVTLKVNLAAPTGGTSAGDVTLSATAQNLVTGVSKKAEGTKGITYKLSATVAAGVVSQATRTVTLTVTDG
ncbi:MAG: hypothetical protein FJX75_19970 [Armatimonadetes bacterium]|nr:hypothetical protein [Armatimonadota bacterium]